MQFHWTQTHYWEHSLLLPPLTTENPEELYTTLWGKTIQSFFLKPDTRSLSSSSISFSHILFNPSYKSSISIFAILNWKTGLQKNWSNTIKATYCFEHQWRIQELQTALRFERPVLLLAWGQEQIIAEVFPTVLEELVKQRLLFFQSQFPPVQWCLCLQEGARGQKTVIHPEHRKKTLKHCATKHKNSLRTEKKKQTHRRQKTPKGPNQRISEFLWSIFRQWFYLYNDYGLTSKFSR